ncbi:MAG: hypothetical protein BMS9Abin28_0506 [Anaerolineae bacterium]|nr:MAG: hypothetical protein BMS9Abin28_0506 [Anaerolineae bacterium]
MLLAAGVWETENAVIALEIGTNAEISLAAGGRLLYCSCASGPAFEGAHIHDGMRATPGAIERVQIEDMQRRGLPPPGLITTDGAPGLIRAVEEAWPKSLRQRCLAHKIRNVIDKVPDGTKADVKAMAQSAYYAPNRQVGEMFAQDLLDRYQDQYPSAMKAFTEGLELKLVSATLWQVHLQPFRNRLFKAASQSPLSLSRMPRLVSTLPELAR